MSSKPGEDILGLGGLPFAMKFGKAPYQVGNSAEEIENPVAATLARVARGKVDIRYDCDLERILAWSALFGSLFVAT